MPTNFTGTVVLGGVLVSDVYRHLAMPEFSATMVGPMGMRPARTSVSSYRKKPRFPETLAGP
jgi:hypothetical protein